MPLNVKRQSLLDNNNIYIYMSSRKQISNTFTVTTMDDPVSVQAQYSPDKTTIHTTWQDGDLYMRTRESDSDTWSGWHRIVGENGNETDYSFGISQYKTTTNATTAPSDISTWSDAPLAVTSAKPYLWSKVVKKSWNASTQSYDTDSTTYIRLTGEDGADGETYLIESTVGSVTIGEGETSGAISTTLSFFKKVGANNREAYSCYCTIFKKKGATYTSIRQFTTKGAAVTYTNNSISVNDYDAISVCIYNTASTTHSGYLAELEIPIIKHGDNGKSITSANVWYALTQSKTTIPADTAFTYDDFPTTLNAGYYIWQATKVTYSEGNPEFTGKMCLGATSDFLSGTEVYAISTSNSTTPTSWSTSYQKTKGYYLWTATQVTYTNGNKAYLNPKCIGYWGEDGITVQAQYAPNSNPSSSQIHTTWQDGDLYMRTKQSNETTWSSWHKIVGETGDETDYTFALSAYKDPSSSGYPQDLGSQDSYWSDAPVPVTTSKPYLWARVQKKTYNNGTATILSTTYIRITAEDGENGITAPYLASHTTQFAYSSSGAIAPTTGWGNAILVPTAEASEKYVWRRDTWTYDAPEMGRNMFRNSGNMIAGTTVGTWKDSGETGTFASTTSNLPLSGVNGVIINEVDGKDMQIQTRSNLTLDAKYLTLSCYVKASSANVGITLYPAWRQGHDISNYIKSFTIGTEWTRVTHTAKINTAGEYSGALIRINANQSGKSITVCAPKLEYGSEATEWVIAPEDLSHTETAVWAVYGEDTALAFATPDKITIPCGVTGYVSSAITQGVTFSMKVGTKAATVSSVSAGTKPAGVTVTGVASNAVTITVSTNATASGLAAGVTFTVTGTYGGNSYSATITVALIGAIKGNQGDSITGPRGKIGRFYYYAQEWYSTSSISYAVTDTEAPFFFYNNNYWVFNPDSNGTYSMSSMGTPSSSNTNWELMVTDFKYIVTEAIFGSYAHFGSFIINADWLISERGKIYNASTGRYEESSQYTRFDPDMPTGTGVIGITNAVINRTSARKSEYFNLVGGAYYYIDVTVVLSIQQTVTVQICNSSGTTLYQTSISSSGTATLGFYTSSTVSNYYIQCYTDVGQSTISSIAKRSNYTFVPNFAVDGMTGKIYLNDAYVRGDVQANSILSSNDEMETVIEAGSVVIRSKTTRSYGEFRINSNGEVVLSMFGANGKKVVDIGGTPETLINGEWKVWQLCAKERDHLSDGTTYYTATEADCTTYYQLNLGQVLSSDSTLKYFLPPATGATQGVETTDTDVIVRDLRVFTSKATASSASGLETAIKGLPYIANGYYVKPNNGRFEIEANMYGPTNKKVDLYHFVSGVLTEVITQRFGL